MLLSICIIIYLLIGCCAFLRARAVILHNVPVIWDMRSTFGKFIFFIRCLLIWPTDVVGLMRAQMEDEDNKEHEQELVLGFMWLALSEQMKYDLMK